MPRSSLKRMSKKIRRVRISKHGAYSYSNPGPVGKVGRRVGRAIGASLGSKYGLANVGAEVGERVGGLIHYPAKWLGSGAYSLDNVHAGQTISPMNPQFTDGKDYVVICHREYIGDVLSAGSPVGTFSINDYPIQPGSQKTFPWLSSVVGSTFQSYMFEGCIFEFQSRSADALNSTNTALGTVVAAINYDSSDEPFTTRAEMENTSWSHSSAPSKSFVIPVECEKKQTALGGMLYIRHASPPAGTDIKTYDLGRLSIASVGCQGSAVNLGSLYVTYKIRLYKPVILKPLTQAYQFHMRLSGAPTTLLPLGPTGGRSVVWNNMNCQVNDNVVTFDRNFVRQGMRFIMLFVNQWQSTTGNLSYGDITFTDLAGVAKFNNGSVNGYANNQINTMTPGLLNRTFMFEIRNEISQQNPTITFTTAGPAAYNASIS